jgi:hypothetical protein
MTIVYRARFVRCRPARALVTPPFGPVRPAPRQALLDQRVAHVSAVPIDGHQRPLAFAAAFVTETLDRPGAGIEDLQQAGAGLMRQGDLAGAAADLRLRLVIYSM